MKHKFCFISKRLFIEETKNLFQVIISNENVQILENGSLIIKEVSKDDKGYYMCQATNDVGSGLSTVVHLKVHGKDFLFFIFLFHFSNFLLKIVFKICLN